MNNFLIADFEYRYSVSEGIRMFRSPNTGLYGYLDAYTGETIIAPKYQGGLSFSEGLACVQNSEGLWGYIDTHGKIIIACKYLEAHSFKNNRACVSLKDRWGYIYPDGGWWMYLENSIGLKPVEPFLLDDIIKVVIPSKVGENSREVLYNWLRKKILTTAPYVYIKQGCKTFNDILIGCTAGGVYSLLCPKSGETIGTNEFRLVLTEFNDGLAYTRIMREDGELSHVFIDKSGKVVICLDCYKITQRIPVFNEGYACIYTTNGTFFINTAGEHYSGGKSFNNGLNFSEGLAAVQDKTTHLWGFVNLQGELAIPYVFEDAGSFKDGYAVVEYNNQSFYIDKNGYRL